MINARSNNASALTRKANSALRNAGVEGVKVKCDDYVRGGTVKGPLAALIVAQGVLTAAGIEVSPLATYSWGTQFYIQTGEQA